jgi:hypothetical protein
MKTQLLLIALTSILTFQFSHAQKRTFIREYTYRASDNDSKISSREKALKEVKALLLEELGTYVESYVNYETTETDGKITKEFFTNEIKSTSAGMAEAKIIDEKWDGYNYYIKAELQADPEEVIRRINQTLSKRRASLVIDSLQLLLHSNESELLLKERELLAIKNQVESKNIEVKQKGAHVDSLKQELVLAQSKLEQYQQEELAIEKELRSIIESYKKLSNKARKYGKIGLSYNEFRELVGEYRGEPDDGYVDIKTYNYGEVWVTFEHRLLIAVWEDSFFKKLQVVDNYCDMLCRIQRHLNSSYNKAKKMY